ncbi:MAG: glutathione S-transferase family protein [Hyphomicrobium sp.]|nr:glutathione S-transferase family protein [Hyphomicrobium sp.]
MNRLIHFPFCARSRSIRIALVELGWDVHFEEEDPSAWRPDFVALNPACEVPVLVVSGLATVAGVYAISEFLDEAARDYDTSDEHIQLFPGDSVARAEVRRLVDWFHGKLDRDATGELVEQKLVRRVRGAGEPPPSGENLRAAHANLRYHLRYVNHLAGQRDWLAGDALSFADMAASGHFSVLDYAGIISWDEFPAAKSWYMRIKSRPSVRPLLQDRLLGLSPAPIYAELDF